VNPTIPLLEWKISSNLKASRIIQNQEGLPAYNCKCEWCVFWKLNYFEILPEALMAQMKRLGVDLLNPTDLYKFGGTKQEPELRITYHTVGKVLEGPSVWVENELGNYLSYYLIPNYNHIGVVLMTASSSSAFHPSYSGTSGEVLIIDLRLKITDNKNV